MHGTMMFQPIEVLHPLGAGVLIVSSEQRSLRGIALFDVMETADRVGMERRCVWRDVAAGEQVIGQGDGCNDVFFVVTGRVRVVLYSAAGKVVSLGEIGAGEMFGEYSAFDKAPRSATIEALQPSLLAVMPSDVFVDVVAG